MRFRLFKSVVTLLLPILILSACGDSEKELREKKAAKAKQELAEANAVAKGGDLDRAEELLDGIVAAYPETVAATEAKKSILRIEAKRLNDLKQEVAPTLTSLRNILQGYFSQYGEFPRSMGDFDTSGYFFDSEYVADLIPEKFQVYLKLKDAEQDYKIWLVWAAENIGFVQEASAADSLDPWAIEELRSEVDSYQVELSKGNLTCIAAGKGETTGS